MTLYPPTDKPQMSAIDFVKTGTWALYADVKCEECGHETALANAGDIGSECKRCGGRYL